MAFPFYKQYDTMDCGPTCIKMIAKFYKKDFSLQFLRDKCNIGKLGVSMLGISRAAESIGFKTVGAQVSFDQLSEQVPLPCIAHWDQNHFVVLYKIKNDAVYLSNPDTGLLKYSLDDFLKHWSIPRPEKHDEGVVLILEPTEKFFSLETGPVSKAAFTDIFKYFRNFRQSLFQLFFALLIGSLFQILFPFLTQSIVDVGVQEKNLHFIYVILIAQMILYIGQFGSNLFRNWLLLYMSTKINVSILSDFVLKLLRVPISFFDIKLAGDIIQRMNDHRKIEAFLTGSTISTIFSIFNLITFGIALIIYNQTIFFVYILFSTFYVIYIFLFLKKRGSIEGKTMEISSLIQSNSLQMIYGIQEIRLNNAETVKRWEWEGLQANLFKNSIQKLRIEQIQEVGAFLLNQFKNILITFYTAKLVITGQLTLGQMLACQYIIGQLNGPLEQLIQFMLAAQDAKLALNRITEINEIQDEEPAGKYQTIPDESPILQDICFENVSFQYPGLTFNILNQINARISKGKITAIVGASGSGKTTFIKLLLKVYDPTEGYIKTGKESFTNLSPSAWREKVGTVMQDGYIFSDTIEKNITISNSKKPTDPGLLEKAIYISNLHDILTALPNGIHTKIGSEGMGLSQGQKQRILIARAIYKNPEILILDEATNSLDTNNEKEIAQKLASFFSGKTVVIIAHRLSTVKNADHIIVLDQGRIAEAGSHTELISKKDFYFRLVKNQIQLDG